MPNTPVTHI